jgi:hypothetical protein
MSNELKMMCKRAGLSQLEVLSWDSSGVNEEKYETLGRARRFSCQDLKVGYTEHEESGANF